MEPQSGTTMLMGTVGKGPMEFIREFSGLTSDSREVKPGYLFAALSGSKADGAAYIADAVRRGAAAVLAVPERRVEVERLGVRFIADENPRAQLARFAAAWFGEQPETVAAITGTNGKTSVAVFLRQIWERLGRKAASMGTIGIAAAGIQIPLKHTTPDPVEMQCLLARLKRAGIDRVALEASSHGLDQHRLDGVEIAAAAFTNITRDHLDYHETFERYLIAKLQLFKELVRDKGVGVVNADADCAQHFADAAVARGIRLITIGVRGDTLRLQSQQPRMDGQKLRVGYEQKIFEVALPLVGGFQASNALIAAGLAIGLGEEAAAVFNALESLKGAPGRLELVARAASGAPIYVDYAHTPDALETVLKAIRPHVEGKLCVVFGCGGDRDKGKRPLMGAAAAMLADLVIVTDDNPRSEAPAAIRREILAGAHGAREIADRAEAIQAAIASLGSSDALVIAGKGHESGQIVGNLVRPFLDRDVAIEAAQKLGGPEALP